MAERITSLESQVSQLQQASKRAGKRSIEDDDD